MVPAFATAQLNRGLVAWWKFDQGSGNRALESIHQEQDPPAYVSAYDDDIPGLSVFTRRDGTVRHFWSGEMSGEMADPGQDPRGAPDLDPLMDNSRPHALGSWRYLVPKLEYASLTTIK